jgi:hypothetical protein
MGCSGGCLLSQGGSGRRRLFTGERGVQRPRCSRRRSPRGLTRTSPRPPLPAAGVVAIDLARQMLQLYPNTYVLVVSTENITQNWYFGNDRSM